MRPSIPRLLVILWVAASLAAAPSRVSADAPLEPPSPEAAEALRLLESKDAYKRKVGFLRLEALREPPTADRIRVYLESRDPDMRADSLRALAAIEGEKAIPVLLEQLKTDKKARVRWSALLALEPFQKGHPELLPVFIDALRDYRTEVRIAAVDIVSRIDDPTAREAIRTRFRKEQRSDVRRALRTAMQRLGD